MENVQTDATELLNTCSSSTATQGPAPIWPETWSKHTIYSALGAAFDVPANWRVSAKANAISAMHIGRIDDRPPFAPLQVFCAQVAEQGLGELEQRVRNALTAKGAQEIESQIVIAPRGVVISDYIAPFDAGPVRCRSVSELLDDGQLVLSFTFCDWVRDDTRSLDRAMSIWRDSRLMLPALPRNHRRLINEEAGYQLRFPERWFIDCATGELTVVRQPGRQRTHPSITIQSALGAQRPRNIEAMTDRLGWRFETAKETRIGGRHAVFIDYERAGSGDQTEHVREIVVEPTLLAAHYIQLATYDESTAMLDRMQKLVVWL
jgi:hypothetical protein